MIARWWLQAEGEPARLLRALARSFRCRFSPKEAIPLRWADTFDRRLFARGLELRREGAPEDPEAPWRLLSALRGEVMARGTGPLLPEWPEDFAPGPLADRLRELLQPRRLFASSELCLLRRTAELKGSDGERIATLTLEEAAHQTETFRPRLSLVVVRGYEREGQEILAQLNGRPELLFGATSPIESVDFAACLPPLPPLLLHPETAAHSAARSILRDLAKEMQRQEAGLILDLDPEFLHDWRVTLRRLRSLLKDLRVAFIPGLLEPFRLLFQELGRVSSPPRDADVWLLALPQLKSLLPVSLAPGLAPLEQRLKEQKQSAHADLVQALQSSRIQEGLAAFQVLMQDEGLPPEAMVPSAHAPIQRVAAAIAQKRLRQFLAEGRAIASDTPSVAYHELRKRGKGLRYLIDTFGQVLAPDEVKESVRSLKRLQENLGDIQDFEVQSQDLARFRAELHSEDDLLLDSALSALAADRESRQDAAMTAFRTTFDAFRKDGAIKALRGRLASIGGAE